MKRLILSILIPAILLCSCRKQEDAIFSGTEAGNIQAGIFITDDGIKMTVVGNDNGFDINSARRVLIAYETRSVLEAGNTNIDLHRLWDAQIVTPVLSDGNPEDTADTPVQITDAWFSANYLNIVAAFPASDPALHSFTAAYSADAAGSSIRLYHDGTEDTASDAATQTAFISIPMESVRAAYEQAASGQGRTVAYPMPVLLQWTWYRQEGGQPTLLEREGSYTPSR